MKDKISTNKILASTSLVFGILSLFSFVLYFYSANHAPYTYIDVIFLGPLWSFIGIVISIITRKSRKIHPALWISGIISCMFGFIVCMLVFSMLIVLMAAKQVLKPRDVLQLLEQAEGPKQQKLREIIKVIRVHSQDEIEIEWNFDDIFSEQR